MKYPIIIRGEAFGTVEEAASARRVSPRTIRSAAGRGRLDFVGIGRGGGQGSPCRVNGHDYPSQVAAARGEGVSPQRICAALSAGHEDRVGRRKRA